MTDFYRFPAIEKLQELDNTGQIQKIEEEVEESHKAYYGNNGEIPYGVELMDVIHAAETALRMNFNDDEIASLYNLVIEKNRKRGYYGKEK